MAVHGSDIPELSLILYSDFSRWLFSSYFAFAAVVTLKKGEGRLLKSGGMWIFDNEVASIMGSFVNGDIVLVHDFDGYPLGRGFINTNSRGSEKKS